MTKRPDGDKQRREAKCAELLLKWTREGAGADWEFTAGGHARNADEWGACGFEAKTWDDRRFRIIVSEVEE